jgi:hypothetical protein
MRLSKWEEEYTPILTAIVNSPFVQEGRTKRNIKEEIEWAGYPDRDTDFQLQVLSDFFEQDMKEIVEIEAVWKWLSGRIKGELDGIWNDKEIVANLGQGDTICMEKSIGDLLQYLEEALAALYHKQLDAYWKGKTVKEAKLNLVLKPGILYVAFLDKDGLLTREPYPVSMDVNAEVKCKFITTKTPGLWTPIHMRELDIAVNPPIKSKGHDTTMVGRRIRASNEEVKFEVFQITLQ